jgi:hypothetical protein
MAEICAAKQMMNAWGSLPAVIAGFPAITAGIAANYLQAAMRKDSYWNREFVAYVSVKQYHQ